MTTESTVNEQGEELPSVCVIVPTHFAGPVLTRTSKLNIMDQYRPEAYADPTSPLYDPKYSDIARRPTDEEIRTAYEYAKQLGIKFDLISLERRYH